MLTVEPTADSKINLNKCFYFNRWCILFQHQAKIYRNHCLCDDLWCGTSSGLHSEWVENLPWERFRWVWDCSCFTSVLFDCSRSIGILQNEVNLCSSKNMYWNMYKRNGKNNYSKWQPCVHENNSNSQTARSWIHIFLLQLTGSKHCLDNLWSWFEPKSWSFMDEVCQCVKNLRFILNSLWINKINEI